MVSIPAFRKIALSFPDTEEHAHFEKASFRIKKKIFATLSEPAARVVIKLNPEDQFIYCKINPQEIYPVPGNWGIKGWICIELKTVPRALLLELLELGYKTVLKKK